MVLSICLTQELGKPKLLDAPGCVRCAQQAYLAICRCQHHYGSSGCEATTLEADAAFKLMLSTVSCASCG